MTFTTDQNFHSSIFKVMETLKLICCMSLFLFLLSYPNSDCLNIEIVIFNSQRAYNFRKEILYSLHQPKTTTSLTMVFTATKSTAFFTEVTQMDIFERSCQVL